METLHNCSLGLVGSKLQIANTERLELLIIDAMSLPPAMCVRRQTRDTRSPLSFDLL